MTWRSRSACLGEDPELFFPIGSAYPALLQIEEAKVVCRRCEVIETCLKWASHSGQDSGVWGGLSADERQSLKRRNARAHRASRVTPSLRGGTGAGPRPDPDPDQKCGPGQDRGPTPPT
jgi:WhiB family redox-sensing transcriptional regulator